jgi:hypothetical protein
VLPSESQYTTRYQLCRTYLVIFQCFEGTDDYYHLSLLTEHHQPLEYKAFQPISSTSNKNAVVPLPYATYYLALPICGGVVKLQLSFQSCTDVFSGPFRTELSPNALESMSAGILCFRGVFWGWGWDFGILMAYRLKVEVYEVRVNVSWEA